MIRALEIQTLFQCGREAKSAAVHLHVPPGIVIRIKNSFAISQLLGKHLLSFNSLLYLFVPKILKEIKLLLSHRSLVMMLLLKRKKENNHWGLERLVLVQVENHEDL